MRQKLDTQAVTGILREMEQASGMTIPEAKRAGILHQVQQLLAAVDANRPTESKQVSILLSDLRGFTALAGRHSAREVIELLNRYFSRMCEVIFEHGGTIDKFMGDGIMVLFGAPESGRDDLQRAIACATVMQQVMGEVNDTNHRLGMPQLFMGIGINTGEVVAANLGSDLHREYTVIGDNVNLASRIEAHSLRGQVLLSEQSYQLARDYVVIGDVKEVLVKGRRDPVRLHELRATTLPRYMEVPVREERKGPRVPTDMPFRFQILDGKHVLPEVHRGRIADISYSGMLARLQTPVQANTEIRFSVALSLLGCEIHDIYARVLRVREATQDYECSIEFTSIDPEGQLAVRQFVDLAVC